MEKQNNVKPLAVLQFIPNLCACVTNSNIIQIYTVQQSRQPPLLYHLVLVSFNSTFKYVVFFFFQKLSKLPFCLFQLVTFCCSLVTKPLHSVSSQVAVALSTSKQLFFSPSRSCAFHLLIKALSIFISQPILISYQLVPISDLMLFVKAPLSYFTI